ncbi:C39 family peptidase [Aquibacillus kalidii]|uniref:C39 family peptidase n=1 Tax=Aquibacillus kalidii TaxID=2762597 RepID=UPI001F3D9860|nr:C39 family peptidase [Aquibacillus kalidii]
MLFYIFGLCLTMAIILLVFQSKAPKHIYRYVMLIYAFLFGLSSVVVALFLMNTHKNEIYNWFKSHSTESYALAEELPSPALEPVFPLVEQIQMRESVRLDAPLIGQYPELPRGCEVTSLAMLLQYYNIDVDKMELAKEVTKDPTKYKRTEDGIYFGNPSRGFVGDMYSFTKPGLGVYHKPIAELAKQYVGDDVLDFSGESFYQILMHLNQDRPVWVITNTTYKKLPEEQFSTWQTADGPIKVTKKEHSVLVTGFDKDYIYFNDPIKKDIRKAPIKDFQEAWVQMGQQAITVVKP